MPHASPLPDKALESGPVCPVHRAELRREKIGFTFQSNNLIPFLTAQENVEFMLRLNGQADKAGRVRSAEILARLGLSDRLHNLPAQLSGGQQKLAALARALISGTKVLLLDEPFEGVAPVLARRLVTTLYAQG